MANGARVPTPPEIATSPGMRAAKDVSGTRAVVTPDHMAAGTAVADTSYMANAAGVPATRWVPAAARVTASTMAAARAVAPRRARKHKQASS
ncbi:MAG: hypothetical protein ABR961_09650 [Thermoanaerobaculaceae bacterium]